MSSSTLKHDNISGENISSRESLSSASCSKMVQQEGSSSLSNLAYQQPSSIAGISGNAHCSISQQTGNNAGLAPIMEIREMNSYCNPGIPVGTEKYHWNHHHSHHHSHANVVRHPPVYPQMFYTPPPSHTHSPVPPPPPGNYASSSAGVVSTVVSSNEWNCPPSSVDSYSHFIYSQYAPPPPPTQHHDYSSYLGITTSCYEPDNMMLLANVPGPSTQISIQSSCDSSSTPVSAQPIMNPFMFPATLPPPPPPPLPSFEATIPMSSTATNAQKRHSEIENRPGPYSGPHLLPASQSSSSSVDSSEDSEDDDSKHIISIEDDDNDNIVDADIDSSCGSPTSVLSSSQCVLCKKSATFIAGLPQNAPSPQLSRILDNIDDDELDISVCSGDIEIGGIEDEMIQPITEQQPQRVSLTKLSHLLGITITDLPGASQSELVSSPNDENLALLCFKCQRLVSLAESLEKQLTSVLTTLKQVIFLEDEVFSNEDFRLVSSKVVSTAIQTDEYITETESNYINVHRWNKEYPVITASKPVFNEYIQNQDMETSHIPDNRNHCLCHVCGRTFNCRRNLGKHLKRYHKQNQDVILTVASNNLKICPREACGKTFNDKAALRIHLRKHTSEKSYFCTKCLKLFTTKSNLNAHSKANVCMKQCEPTLERSESSTDIIAKRNVENVPSFTCENCGLTFRTQSRFQSHITSKLKCSKQKVFACELCTQVFAKRSELNVHQAVHTKTKSFRCDICGMGFTTKGNQIVHQRTHFAGKRFKCSHCDKGFTRNQTMQNHILSVHR